MGIDYHLVEFDYEKMRITHNAKTKNLVYHIEKVNNDTFLTGSFRENIELINKKDLTCLSYFKFYGVIN